MKEGGKFADIQNAIQKRRERKFRIEGILSLSEKMRGRFQERHTASSSAI